MHMSPSPAFVALVVRGDTSVAAAAANGSTTMLAGSTTSATIPLFLNNTGGGSGDKLCKTAAGAKSPHRFAAHSDSTSDARPELHQ